MGNNNKNTKDELSEKDKIQIKAENPEAKVDVEKEMDNPNTKTDLKKEIENPKAKVDVEKEIENLDTRTEIEKEIENPESKADFEYDNVLEDDTQDIGVEESIENEKDADFEEGADFEKDADLEEDIELEENTDSDEDVDFDDEDEDIFEALLKNSEIKSDKAKKKKAGVKVYALVFFWILFIFLAVVFFFYFMKDLPFFNKDKAASNTDVVTNTYEFNAYPEINMLITEFLSHIASGNEDGLRALVVDPNGSMEQYLNRAFYITEYSNINCYTLPGYSENETIVYVTYNITIPEVESKPIDIQQFYVVNTEYGYKIDNTAHSVEVATYINEQNLTESVQALYESIKNSIDQSLQDDPTFASFYEEILNVQGN